MDDEISFLQWVIGGIVGIWLTIQSAVTNRLFHRIDSLEANKGDGKEMDRRFTELNEKIDRHDDRNTAAHAKIFDRLGDQGADLARIEGKIDGLHEAER